MNRTRKLLTLLLAACLLTGCTRTPSGPEPTAVPTATAVPDMTRSSGSGFYFDTHVTVTFYGADETLLEDVWAACARYEQLLSRTLPESDVSRINAAGGETVTVAPETWAILQRAKELSRMTDGAFSVTIAPLSALWDFTGGTRRMPTDAERLAALPLVDDQAIVLGDGHTVTLPAGMQIDLGGIAKGYIADRIADMARTRCYGMVLSLGGNVYVTGDKPDGTLNSVGIQDPKKPTGIPLSVIFAKNISAVTSGTYERGFYGPDALWYHHILDPGTGSSARSDLASATLVLTSSMDADALATACIVMGSEKALAFVKENGLDALFITGDGRTLASEGFMEKYQYVLYEELVRK